jgi:type III pantothenate kinase
MLLVLDVGNTNTVLGVFEAAAGGDGAHYEKLIAHWRITTAKTQTADEYGVLLRHLFAMNGLKGESVQGLDFTRGLREVFPDEAIVY